MRQWAGKGRVIGFFPSIWLTMSLAHAISRSQDFDIVQRRFSFSLHETKIRVSSPPRTRVSTSVSVSLASERANYLLSSRLFHQSALLRISATNWRLRRAGKKLVANWRWESSRRGVVPREFVFSLTPSLALFSSWTWSSISCLGSTFNEKADIGFPLSMSTFPSYLTLLLNLARNSWTVSRHEYPRRNY